MPVSADADGRVLCVSQGPGPENVARTPAAGLEARDVGRD
eukprot:SAG31_NODE_29314_length_397_cov_0.711409_1_plen_39_part_10